MPWVIIGRHWSRGNVSLLDIFGLVDFTAVYPSRPE
jgi:hypothetical protein